MKFSIFDWLDESGRPYAQTYEERLKLLELADEAGFYAYLLAEHHGTSLSTTPSPTVFLSAVAQRTRRLRLGALAWVLPIYDPLRLYEELCMLDHLSHGRLELGVSRGSNPFESLRHGVVREESRARFEEVFRLLIMGFTEGRLDLQGQYHRYDNVPTRFRPLQKPYPPIWYPTSSADSITYAATHGFNFAVSLLNSPSIERVSEMLHRYRAEFEAHKEEAGRLNAHVAEPAMAFSTHIHLADSDERACEQARAAYTRFNDNYTRRYVELGQGERFAGRPGFDEHVQASRIICGSPETVRTTLTRHVDQTRANHFIGVFAFGDLPYEHTRRSLELFAREVMPSFRQG